MFRCLLLMLVVCAGRAGAEKVATMPKPAGYVDNYAGVISAGTKAQMEAW